MKKKLFFTVMLVCFATLGLLFVGCGDSGGDDPVVDNGLTGFLSELDMKTATPSEDLLNHLTIENYNYISGLVGGYKGWNHYANGSQISIDDGPYEDAYGLLMVWTGRSLSDFNKIKNELNGWDANDPPDGVHWSAYKYEVSAPGAYYIGWFNAPSFATFELVFFQNDTNYPIGFMPAGTLLFGINALLYKD